jgi:carbon monoxide dehydrogenase subunit G
VPNAQNSVTINKPMGEVFAFLADGENEKQWRPGVKEIRREAAHRVSAPSIGSR